MLLWFVAKNVGIVFGLMYPAYQTFKALDSKDETSQSHLLRYWAVFGLFSAIEFYTDMFVSWIPFYIELKMLILLYLSIPQTKGSITLYEMHMKPWLRNHQEEIDKAIADFKQATLTSVMSYRDRIMAHVDESVRSFLGSKLPTLLPLYNMLSLFIMETISQFRTSTSVPTLEPSSAELLLDTVGSAASLAVEVIVPIASDVCLQQLSTSPDAAELTTQKSAVEESRRTHRRVATFTDENVAPLVRSARSHKKESSVPAKPVATETASKRVKAAKLLQGTPTASRALGANTANRPVPALASKKMSSSVSSISDSILTLSPTRKSSIPKLSV